MAPQDSENYGQNFAKRKQSDAVCGKSPTAHGYYWHSNWHHSRYRL